MHPDQHDHDHGRPDPHGADPHAALAPDGRALRIGVGGPVGSGKTALVAALCRALGEASGWPW